MTYRVVCNNELERLVHEVNRFVERGWQPLGGLAVVPVLTMNDLGDTTTEVLYYQAMWGREIPVKSM